MLPVLVLAVVCGVLAQNVQGNGFPQVSVNISPERFQQMVSARMDKQAWKNQLLNMPLQESLKSNMAQGGGSQGFLGVGNLLGGMVNNVVQNILGLRIKKVDLLQLDIRFDENEKRIFLRVPANLEIELNIPLNLGRLLYLNVALDLQVGVQLYRNPTTRRMQLVLGNCENTPGHIKITLFNNDQPLFKALNDILRVVTNILEKVIPNLLQKQLCPLANGLMQTVLNILQGSISTAANGQSIQLSADSYIISGESMRIDYQGSMQVTGGSSYELPPSSTPLPSVPLGDSSMNIVMSDDLIKTLFLSKMPAQTLTINNEAQVAIFKKSVEAIRGLSLPRGATLETLQISYGAPNVRMTSGKAEMVQEISLTVFGSRPRVANQAFFTIKGKATFAVAFSVSHGKLSFSLSFGSLSELTLENSSVGAFDVWSMYDGISELLSATLIPKANRLLSDGYTLPMVESSETEHFQIATDKDSLVVYTWEEQQVQPQETYVEWVTWEEV